MSMFDFVHKNKRLIQIVLGIIFLPFAFFGVDSYFRGSEGAEVVAIVGDYRITQQEFSRALRERQEAMQAQGQRIDPAQFENAEFRYAILDGMIRQRLLLNQAIKSGMTVSEAQLQTVIGSIPGFQENGKFSIGRYQQFLKGNQMSPLAFESRVRQDLLVQHVDDAFSESSFLPRTVAERLVRISEQQREASEAVISPERYVGQVKLEEGAAKKYYDSRQDEFRVPEQVRIEYVTLSMDNLLQQTPVSPADVKKYYDEHITQFMTKETRQASHILISLDTSAPAEEKQKARAKAQEIYEKVKQNPASFAALAKENSQDPGSAAKGGDLGFFPRGGMVKQFDDVVFQMKPGDIVGPVETQYGFHVIRLDNVRPAKGRSLDEVRGEIEIELKKQVASRRFAELAEALNNKVFEESDSLKPAVELLKSPAQQSGWLARNRADDPKLNNPRLMQGIFSEDVLVNKRNTEAIEVAPGTIVAARVIEHKPSSVRPFEQVSAELTRRLTLQRAAQLAAQDGRAILEKLKQGQAADVSWTNTQLVSRVDSKKLNPVVARQVFKASVNKLPAYTGVEPPQGGYVLIRISRVVEPEKSAPEKQKSMAEGLQQVTGQEAFNAYLASLKQKSEVKIKQEALEKKAQ